MMEGVRPERVAEFMKLGDFDVLRMKREACNVELRKNKRNEGFMKKRRIAVPGVPYADSPVPIASLKISATVLLDIEPRLLEVNLPLPAQLEILKQLIVANPSSEVLQAALTEVCKSTSSNSEAPLSFLVNQDYPVLLAPFCTSQNSQDVVTSVLWILSNISAGGEEAERAVTDSGVIPYLKLQLTPPLSPGLKPAAYLLGNIIQQSSYRRALPQVQELRDLALSAIRREVVDDMDQASGLGYFLTGYLASETSGDLIREISIALAGLLQTSDPDYELISTVQEHLKCTDLGTTYDHFDQSLISELLRPLSYNKPTLLQDSLCALQRIVLADDVHMLTLLASGLLDKVAKILNFPASGVREEGFCLLQAIAQGCKSAVSQLIAHKVLRDAMVGLADSEESVREEALMLFYHICKQGNYEFSLQLVAFGLLEELELIGENSKPEILLVKTTQIFLSISEELLKSGELEKEKKHLTSNKVSEAFCESDCCEMISGLALYPNNRIMAQASDLLAVYFQEEDLIGTAEDDCSPVHQASTFEFS